MKEKKQRKKNVRLVCFKLDESVWGERRGKNRNKRGKPKRGKKTLYK